MITFDDLIKAIASNKPPGDCLVICRRFFSLSTKDNLHRQRGDHLFSEDHLFTLVKAFSQNTSIKYLTFNLFHEKDITFFSPKVCTELGEILKGNTTLKEFYLGLSTYQKLSAACLQSIMLGLIHNKGITSITIARLSLGDNDPHLQSIISLIEGNAYFTHLTLSFNFNLKSEPAKLLGPALSKKRNLLSLDLNWCELDDQSIEYLIQGFQNNTNLTFLSLQRNNISHEGARILSSGLKDHPTLKSLNLSGNKKFDYKASAELAEILNGKVPLSVLNLNCCSIGAMGAGIIAENLKTNNILKVLSLCANPLQDEGAIAVASALQENTTLQKLELRDCEIGPKGVKSIAKMLEVNTTLIELDLYRIEQDDISLQALSTALSQNKTLQTLCLEKCLKKISLDKIKMGLVENTSLTNLVLSQNDIEGSNTAAGKGNIEVIAALLKHHPRLTSLNLAYNSFTKEDLKTILESLEHNYQLRSLIHDGWCSSAASITTILERNKTSKSPQRLAFVSGVYPVKDKLQAKDCALFNVLGRSPIFDRKCMPLIFQFAGFPTESMGYGFSSGDDRETKDTKETKEAKESEKRIVETQKP